MNTKWTLAEPEAATPQNTKERRVASQHLLKRIYNNMHTNEPETPLSFCIHYSLCSFIGNAAIQWNDYREHHWEWDDNREETGAASVPSPQSPCTKITIALEKEKVARRETRWEAQDVLELFCFPPEIYEIAVPEGTGGARRWKETPYKGLCSPLAVWACFQGLIYSSESLNSLLMIKGPYVRGTK